MTSKDKIPKRSIADWQTEAEKQLKGKPVSSLDVDTPEGITLKALYTAADTQGLAFADKAGLNAKLVIDVISKGAAQSWQMENRAETMIDDEFEFGFAVEWMQKDLGIALAEARTNGALLPVTALVNQFYAQVAAMGGKRWDTSSLLRLLTREN